MVRFQRRGQEACGSNHAGLVPINVRSVQSAESTPMVCRRLPNVRPRVPGHAVRRSFRIRTEGRGRSHAHRPITVPTREGQRGSGTAGQLFQPVQSVSISPKRRAQPVTRIVEQNSSYNQLLTASYPSSPQFTCHNRAAMRFPNRITVSNAPSPTVPPRLLAPVETLPTKPENSKTEKVFFPNKLNLTSDKYRANPAPPD
jgi:hypothetical protein